MTKKSHLFPNFHLGIRLIQPAVKVRWQEDGFALLWSESFPPASLLLPHRDVYLPLRGLVAHLDGATPVRERPLVYQEARVKEWERNERHKPLAWLVKQTPGWKRNHFVLWRRGLRLSRVTHSKLATNQMAFSYCHSQMTMKCLSPLNSRTFSCTWMEMSCVKNQRFRGDVSNFTRAITQITIN